MKTYRKRGGEDRHILNLVTEHIDVAVTLYIYVREVLGSDLGWVNLIVTQFLVVFLLLLYTLKYFKTASFQTLINLPLIIIFIFYSTLYKFWS
jgi:hypothetical protein